MELRQIKYFLALCETLNFARAAERCNVSQPSLSRAIQKLEHELGGLLIRRERRLTHLTELGTLVRPMLEQVLSHAELTKSAAELFLNGEKTPLKLGVMATIGPIRLAPFLARFSAENLGVELTLVEAYAPRLHELLLGGSLEVAVAARVDAANGRLRHRRLYRERLVVVFPMGHRFEQGAAVPLRELKDENYLLRANCEMESVIVEHCRKRGFDLRVVYRSEREDWIRTMIAAGRGVTIMPEYTHFGYATLARPLIDPELVREVSLVTVAGRRHDSWVALLLRAIQTHKWADQNATIVPGRSSGSSLSRTPRVTEKASGELSRPRSRSRDE